MNIDFVATVAVIAPDPASSRRLYIDALGLPLQGAGGDYFHSESIFRVQVFRDLAPLPGR
jgi:hypothetical protein